MCCKKCSYLLKLVGIVVNEAHCVQHDLLCIGMKDSGKLFLSSSLGHFEKKGTMNRAL